MLHDTARIHSWCTVGTIQRRQRIRTQRVKLATTRFANSVALKFLSLERLQFNCNQMMKQCLQSNGSTSTGTRNRSINVWNSLELQNLLPDHVLKFQGWRFQVSLELQNMILGEVLKFQRIYFNPTDLEYRYVWAACRILRFHRFIRNSVLEAVLVLLLWHWD